ncbi:MAG TPA: tetratricopeptide repeat protein [Steroidobacteraceae bacterium]|nr:tetratricopeptide repeat protein [Steroidobacteraceae bacterium]
MQRWVGTARSIAWLLLLTCLGVPAAAETDTLTETDPETVAILKHGQSLLAEKQPAAAYDYLASHEIDLAGTPLFDYLLGLAALDSGRAGEASFALTRAVATSPDFAGARLELARAEYEQGQLALSRAQLQYLLTQSPPAATRAVIEEYLAAIDQREQRTGSHWSALAQLGAGYDSNANGSTSEPSFLGFTLDPRNVATSSSFAEMQLGAANTRAFGADTGLISNVQLTRRANRDASFVNQSVVSLDSTLVRTRGAVRYSLGVDGYQGSLDGSDHERGVNLSFGASRSFAEYELGIGLRGGALTYQPESLKILDANRYLAGLSLVRLNVGPKAGRIGGALLIGKDEVRRANSPYGNERYGARLYASWPIQSRSSVSFEVSEMVADYDGLFFGGSRKDRLFGAILAFDLQNFPAANWSIAPRLRYTKSDSDVLLYEYDRFEAVVFVRRSF